MNELASIRPAQAADLDGLIAFPKRTILACYPPFLGREAVEGYIASGAVEKFFEEKLPRCFVLEQDGALTGVAAHTGSFVELLMVDVGLHRKGLGGRLMDHLEALLFESSPEITLESFTRNSQANAFYGKRGWSTVDHYDDTETGVPMIKMSKKRPPPVASANGESRK